MAGAVHEDIDLTNYARRPVRLTIEVAILSDFADIFDVKAGRILRRGEVNSRWFRSRGELRTTYVNRDFRRDLVVAVERAGSTPQFANGRLVFVANLPPKGTWHTVLFYKLVGEHVHEMLPIVYTPTVGAAIQEFSHLFRRPRGVFLNVEDLDGIDRALDATGLGADDIDLVVASDAEAILGIGDWGVDHDGA